MRRTIKSLQNGTENIKGEKGLIKMDPSLPEGASTGSCHSIIGRYGQINTIGTRSQWIWIPKIIRACKISDNGEPSKITRFHYLFSMVSTQQNFTMIWRKILAWDWKCARQRECPTQFQTTSATLSAESECRLCWQNKTCSKLSKI